MAKRGRRPDSELKKIIKAAAAKVAVDEQKQSTITSRVQNAAAILSKAVGAKSSRGFATLSGFATSERSLYSRLKDHRKYQKLDRILGRRAERQRYHKVLKRLAAITKKRVLTRT